MKIYIAGPMSGIPQFNYPAFERAAEVLRAKDYEVVSPAEMDSPELRELALASDTGNISDLRTQDETWGDIMARDVKLVVDDVDGLALLPGWTKSRGARMEAFIALTVQKPLFHYVADAQPYLTPVHIQTVLQLIVMNTVEQQNVERYVA